MLAWTPRHLVSQNRETREMQAKSSVTWPDCGEIFRKWLKSALSVLCRTKQLCMNLRALQARILRPRDTLRQVIVKKDFHLELVMRFLEENDPPSSI